MSVVETGTRACFRVTHQILRPFHADGNLAHTGKRTFIVLMQLLASAEEVQMLML